jgi:hypothetical protein
MADQILFDRLTYIDRLKRGGIDDAQARIHAEALDEALRESVATKRDLQELRVAAKHDIDQLRVATKHDLELAVRDMTIRTGGMLFLLGGFLVAIKYFG